MKLNHRADAAILSTSSRFPIAKDPTSPLAALEISETIPSVRERLLFAVADAHPFDKFRRATSNLRLGEESTAFGVLTAPNFIRVVSSHGAASTIASMNF
jgi:hypothetical protein